MYGVRLNVCSSTPGRLSERNRKDSGDFVSRDVSCFSVVFCTRENRARARVVFELDVSHEFYQRGAHRSCLWLPSEYLRVVNSLLVRNATFGLTKYK